jgi:small subunit ribosomal protein S14
MSKLSVWVRDRKRRELHNKYAEKRKQLKQQGDTRGLDKLPRNSSPTRIRNRCSMTGRPNGYIRQFGLCRNVFRQLAHQGKIPGIKKSSW